MGLEDGFAGILAKLLHSESIKLRRLKVKVELLLLWEDDPDRSASYQAMVNELTENK